MLFSLCLFLITINNYRSFTFLLNLIRLGIIFMRFLHSCLLLLNLWLSMRNYYLFYLFTFP